MGIKYVNLPIVSFGKCEYWYRCGNVAVELGNGLCVACWDRELETSSQKTIQPKESL